VELDTISDVTEPQKIGWLEYLVAVFILVVPMMCAFSPLEQYFTETRDSGVQATLYAPPTAFTASSIENLVTYTVLGLLAMKHWPRMMREARLMLPLAVLILWGGASALWSIDGSHTLHRILHVVSRAVFGVYLVQGFRWRDLIALLTRCFGIILVLCLVMVFVFPEYGLSKLNTYREAWQGVFTEKNFLGGAAILGVLTSGYSLLIGANNRWFAGAVCLGEMLLLVMSHSATSAVALVAALGVVVLAMAANIRERPFVGLCGVALLLLGGGIALTLFANYDSIGELMGRSSDMTGRAPIWHFVLKTIALRPWLGFGYGFWDVLSTEKLNIWYSMGWALPHAHEEFLDVTLQTGIVGLCLEVLCLGVTLLRAARFSVVLGDGRGLYCGLVVVVFCVRGLAETVLTDPSTDGWMWLTISYLSLAHMVKAEALPDSSGGATGRFLPLTL
jgi:exopolysaccharide production protein ExoQ